MLQKFQKTFWEKNLWDRSASCFDIFYTCTSATARLFHLKDQDKCWRSDVTAGTRRINKRWLGFTDATLKCGLYLVTNTDNWSTLEGRAHVLVHCNVNAYSVLANQLNSNKRCFKKKGNGFWFSPCSFVTRTSMRQLWYTCLLWMSTWLWVSCLRKLLWLCCNSTSETPFP